MPPEICPVCGAIVEPDALCCPQCGADDETGWSDDATAQRLGLPDESFDYAHFVKEEFSGAPPSHRPHGISLFWWIVAIALLLALLALIF